MDGTPCLLADMVSSYRGAFVAKKPICKLTMRCIHPTCGLLTRLRLPHGTLVQRSIDIMAGCEADSWLHRPRLNRDFRLLATYFVQKRWIYEGRTWDQGGALVMKKLYHNECYTIKRGARTASETGAVRCPRKMTLLSTHCKLSAVLQSEKFPDIGCRI